MVSLLCYKKDLQNTFESVLMRWMNLELIIQSEVSQKEKDKSRILTHIYMESKKMVINDSKCRAAKETQTYRTDFWTLWEKEEVG